MNPRPYLEPCSHVTEGKSLEDCSTVTLASSCALNPALTLRHERSQGFPPSHQRTKSFCSVVPCAGEPFIYSRAHLGVSLPTGTGCSSRAFPALQSLESPPRRYIAGSSLYLLQCSFQTWSLPAYQCEISLVYFRVPCGSWGGCGSHVHACGRQRSASISL